MSNAVVRYSDEELAEFRALIESKIVKTQENLEGLQSQILEITENTSDEHGGDWVDDSSINNDVEMLNNMAIRQRRYLKDLENALIRIHNKSYGICVVSGELIDKKRLMAVPTTTKSLSAKTAGDQTKAPERPKPRPKPVRPTEKKIISKVIRKPSTNAPKPILSDDDDEDFDFDKDLFFDDDDTITPPVDDLEGIVEEEQDEILDKDGDDLFIDREEGEDDYDEEDEEDMD